MVSSRPNLVIVRAGDNSLHRDWLHVSSSRNWDLIISYFGDDPDLYQKDSLFRSDMKGPKWPPLRALLEEHRHLIKRYDYIWLPDDDLAARGDDINRFFDLCAEHGLELAQPSLAPESPMTHPLLINNTLSKIRYINFVEVMAPCFRSDLLEKVMTTFDASESGWGLDWLWPRYVGAKRSGIAVIDEIIIRHTRPLGGPNYDALAAAGRSPRDELLAFEQRHGIANVRLEIHEVVWKMTRLVARRSGGAWWSLLLIAGFARGIVRSPHRILLMKQLVGRFLWPEKRKAAVSS